MEDRFKLRYWNTISKMMVTEPEIRKNYEFSLNEYITTDRGWIWMQCTGLKDKNGKLIYEGDIITPYIFKDITKKFGNVQVKCEVIYDKKELYYTCKKSNFIQEKRPLSKIIKRDEYDPDGYIVVGNIYENPELVG